MSKRQGNSGKNLPPEPPESPADFGPNLKSGCVYRSKNLCNDLRISSNTLEAWRHKGLKPLVESGGGTKSDYWLSDEVIAFLQKMRDGGHA